MSLLDKVVAAITPPESQDARDQARAEAEAIAEAGDWLSRVLDHHRQVEDAFGAVRAAGDGASRRAAQKRLAVMLTGHSIAEEMAIYPLMAQADEKGHAEMAYTEQAEVKMQMAALENMDPMSRDYLDRLERIRDAVAHHMYEEEGNWFQSVKRKTAAPAQAQVTRRYQEEFDRYVNAGGRAPSSVLSREPRAWNGAAEASVQL